MAKNDKNKGRGSLKDELEEKQVAEDAAVAQQDGFDNFDLTGFEDQEIGFPPYFKGGLGRRCFAVPLLRDERDPNFHRWVLRAEHPLTCQRGAAEDDHEVKLEAGQHFTMSVYTSLPLERFVGIPVFIQCVDEQTTSKGNTVYIWRVMMKPTAENKTRMLANVKRLELPPAHHENAAPVRDGSDLPAS